MWIITLHRCSRSTFLYSYNLNTIIISIISIIVIVIIIITAIIIIQDDSKIYI
jgi:hypothetical protein